MGEQFSGLDRAITALTTVLILFSIVVLGFLIYLFSNSALHLTLAESAELCLGALFDLLMLTAYMAYLRVQRNIYDNSIHNAHEKTQVAFVQPAPHLALIRGETLILRCVPTSRGRWLNVMAWLLLIFAMFNLPSQSHENLFADMLALPAKFAIVHLAIAVIYIPCVLAGSLFAFSALLARNQAIAIDDEGISIRRQFRKHYMQWEEIQGIYRTGADGKDVIYSTMHLCTPTRYVQFNILRQSGPMYNLERYTPADLTEYGDSGHRLLATIVARTHLPIRIERNAVDPMTTLSADDIDALPAATLLWQPTASAMSAAGVHHEAVVLRQRSAWGKYWRSSMIMAISLLIFFGLPLAFYVLRGELVFYAHNILYNPILLSAMLGLIGFVVMLSFATTYLMNRSESLGIVATATGIMRQRTQKEIPWTEIHSWAVYAPERSPSPDAEYILFTGRQKLRWAEPADAQLAGRGVHGDRRAAYRERAEQLHAMIAVHTGLPLREIPTS